MPDKKRKPGVARRYRYTEKYRISERTAADGSLIEVAEYIGGYLKAEHPLKLYKDFRLAARIISCIILWVVIFQLCVNGFTVYQGGVYVFIPAAASLIPLLYLNLGAWKLPSDDRKLQEDVYRFSHVRIRRSLTGIMILFSCEAILILLFFLTSGVSFQAADILLCLLVGISLLLGMILLKEMNNLEYITIGKSVETIKNIIASLHEFNPMMGHRGCRLAVTYPEIAKMQTKAVIRAAINVKKAHPDWEVKPEIMIPLVCEVKELKFVKKTVVETADAEIAASNIKLEYEVGTMIEIPRAALTADEIATEADFFCFGTNDLTQMTFGFSRDDAGKFLSAYYDAKIFESDPFARLDQAGVGKLMEMAIKLGRPVNKNLHVGICGEHGGDPTSVEFCHKIGLDYVSCSPFRVPIARLAAAQAAIADKK